MGQPKKILIVSDTHRKNENYFALLKQLEPLDMVIHCGDAEGSEYAISQAADLKLIIYENSQSEAAELLSGLKEFAPREKKKDEVKIT